MPCLVDFAELSNASYEDSGDAAYELRPPTKASWQRRTKWINRVGFYAALFESGSGASVLIFRGTDDLWDGIVDDGTIALGGMPPQALAALQVVGSCASKQNLSLAGHSLGGALALIAAAHSGLPAVTFNAPGVMDSCVVSARPGKGLRAFLQTVARCAINSRVRNVRIDGDPVSSFFTTGFQVGRGASALSAPQCGLDPLCRHGIRTCIAAVRREPRNYEEIKL